ncbi:MAG: 50S ribosomal protein L30e [Candidatus Micrarchaeia archaeon]|jgi:large subunit ribosomal protein L30e
MTDEKESIEEEEIGETEKTKTKKKTKKVPPRRRKSKKEKESLITKEIRLVVETGKVSFGFKKSLKNTKDSKVLLLIVSNNIPNKNLFEIDHFAKKSKIPLLSFQGSSKDLANICGKPFLVSVLSIYDKGESNIFDLVA